MTRHLSILGIALLLAGAAAAQTVLPQCENTPTPTRTRTRTPTPYPPTRTPTVTMTPTATLTPTPSSTPTQPPPGPTPTPLPSCEDLGGEACASIYAGGCGSGYIALGRSGDCDYLCCQKATPTPTPEPTECGNVCIPLFVREGGQYQIPQYSQHRLVVLKVLRSGWLRVWDADCGDGANCTFWWNLQQTLGIRELELVQLQAPQ